MHREGGAATRSLLRGGHWTTPPHTHTHQLTQPLSHTRSSAHSSGSSAHSSASTNTLWLPSRRQKCPS
eukprot:1007145-Rhodomonas_salina.1